MRQVVQFLLFVSRGLAICAVLAGVVTGLFALSFGPAFICFDTCPSRAVYFSNLDSGMVQLMTPCVLLEALALAAFAAHCLAIGQVRRTIAPILFFLIGGLVGVAALGALLQYGQATLPVGEDGILLEGPAVAWAQQWGLALLLVAGAWSGVLARLQWRR